MVGNKGPDVAKKGGEMWKALSAAAKQPYEKLAQEKKAAYEKFKTTDEGKKALQEKKDAKAEEKTVKTKRDCKAAMKAVEKDDALKKPQSAYWLWLNDHREEIAAKAGSKSVTDVAKKAGEIWKTLSNAQQLPYVDKAKEQKDAYEKFIASDDGQKALKAWKDAKQETKEQFSRSEGAKPTDKKRKAAEDTSPEKDAEAKKARGRPAKAKPEILGA
jgi:structure-specific recognition protein 1